MGRHAGDRGRRRGVRVSAQAWEDFLLRLANLSAIEVSKLPGMPSAPAFVKKRQNDPVFAARAATVIASRQLQNSGRKRITAAAWADFLGRLPHTSVNKLVEVDGMPSMAAVYKRRRSDAGFRAQLDEILRDVRREREFREASALRLAALQRDPEFVRRMLAALQEERSTRVRTPKPPQAPLGEAFNATLLRDSLYAAASAAVSEKIEPTARLDIIGDLVLAVLEGEIELADLPKAAKEFARRHWKLFGTIGVVSLDAPLKSGRGTLLDMISADTALWR